MHQIPAKQLAVEVPTGFVHVLELNKTKYYVARVRQETVPTERKPLVREVSANFCG
jgi:hypothetical protein